MRNNPMSADSRVPNLALSAIDSIDLFPDIRAPLPNTTDLLTGDMQTALDSTASLLTDGVLLAPNGLDFLQDAESLQMIELMCMQPRQDAQSAPEEKEGVVTDCSFFAPAPTLDDKFLDDRPLSPTLNDLGSGEPQKDEDAGQEKSLEEFFAAELQLLRESLGLQSDGEVWPFQADTPEVVFGFELGRDNPVVMGQDAPSLPHTASAIASAHTVVNPSEPNQAQHPTLASRRSLRNHSVSGGEAQDKQSNQFHPYQHALTGKKTVAPVVSEQVTSKKPGKPKKSAPIALEFLTPAEQEKRLQNKHYAQAKRDKKKAERLYAVEQLQIACKATLELQQEIMALKIQLGMLLCPPDSEDDRYPGLSMAPASSHLASKQSQPKKKISALTCYAKQLKDYALELDLAATIEENQALQAERDILRAQVPVPRRSLSLRL